MEYIDSDIILQDRPIIHEINHDYNTNIPINYTSVLPGMDNTTDNF